MSSVLKKGSEHYKHGGIQPIEYIMANDLGFCEGNVVKYITRWKHSDQPQQDLEKAKHYIEFLLAKFNGEAFNGLSG